MAKLISLYKYGKVHRGLKLYKKITDGVEKDPFEITSIFANSWEDPEIKSYEEIELGKFAIHLGSRAIKNVDGNYSTINLVDLPAMSKMWYVNKEESEDAEA